MKNYWRKALLASCLCLGLIGASHRAIAQEEVQTSEQEADSSQNRICSFVGGSEALIEYLSDKGSGVNYPIEAWDSGAQGRVYVAGEVQEDGSLEHIRILKKVHPALARSAYDVAKHMPKWLPALRDGKAIKQLTSFCIVYHRPQWKYQYAKFLHPASFKKDGIKGLKKYLAKNVKYPDLANKLKVRGKIIVGFTITEDGSIQEVEILKGLSPLLEEEAIRVVKAMPKWIPARLEDGTAVPTRFSLPIIFR